MANFTVNLLLILLIASVLPTAVMSMPILWVICMSSCTAATTPIALLGCIAMCAPLLPAPTP